MSQGLREFKVEEYQDFSTVHEGGVVRKSLLVFADKIVGREMQGISNP